MNKISVPNNWKGKDVLWHFGVFDWKTEVWLNDIKIGCHTKWCGKTCQVVTLIIDGNAPTILKEIN